MRNQFFFHIYLRDTMSQSIPSMIQLARTIKGACQMYVSVIDRNRARIQAKNECEKEADKQ